MESVWSLGILQKKFREESERDRFDEYMGNGKSPGGLEQNTNLPPKRYEGMRSSFEELQQRDTGCYIFPISIGNGIPFFGAKKKMLICFRIPVRQVVGENLSSATDQKSQTGLG